MRRAPNLFQGKKGSQRKSEPERQPRRRQKNPGAKTILRGQPRHKLKEGSKHLTPAEAGSWTQEKEKEKNSQFVGGKNDKNGKRRETDRALNEKQKEKMTCVSARVEKKTRKGRLEKK